MRIQILFLLPTLALGFSVEYLRGRAKENVHTKHARIAGGSVPRAHEYPHQVSLQTFDLFTGWYHFCGGTIIGKYKILTAARCLKDYDGSWWLYRVVAGAHNIASWETSQQYSQFYDVSFHPNYSKLSNDYDYAVITTLASFQLDGRTVSAIDLQDESYDPLSPCYVAGWGHSENGAPSYILRHVELQFIPQTQCNSDYPNLTGQMMCAEPTAKEGFCYGDEGGALVCNGGTKLAGIASWFQDSCASTSPQVYADVRKAVGWIRSV